MKKISALPVLILSLLIGLSNSVSAQQKSSLLWEISGNGLEKPSYLYGTMHVSKKIAFHLGDTFFHALENADMVCLESNPGKWLFEMYNSDDLMMRSRIAGRNYQSGNFYEKLVNIDEPNKKALKRALRAKHRLENGFLYRGSNHNEEYEENTYLDLFIYQYARKKAIPVQNLEHFKETNKLQLLAMIPDEETEEEKKNKKRQKSYYSKWNKEMSVSEALEEAYRNGNLPIIDSITKMTARSDNYLKYFLYARNQNMVNGIDTLIKSNTLFIGVGAAHLPGEEGMIEMLRKLGYKMRPVTRNKSALVTNKKNDIEKTFLDLNYKPFTTKDGYITVNVPGDLYETKGKRGDLQYFYPDMANGGNFFISRFQTFAPLHLTDVDFWKKKVDSLLFENVEGKIIEQKETKISGFDAIYILNKTRRGDYQQKMIVFTPLEVIFFRMAGTGEWAKTFGDRFISSIKINNASAGKTKFTSPLNDYNITFPGQFVQTLHGLEITSSPPSYAVQSYTKTDSAYYLLKSDWLNDFTYIEEDTFELKFIMQTFQDAIDSSSEVSYTLVNNESANGFFTIAKDTVYLKTLLKNNFYYLLAAKTTKNKALSYFNSFTYTGSFKEDDYVNYHDTILKYSVTTPVVPSESEDLIRFVRSKTEDKKDAWDYVKDSRNFFYKNNYESISVKYLKHSDYYHFETLNEFWKEELKGYLEASFIIEKEVYKNNDTLPTAHLILADTGSQKVIEVKTYINKGVVYNVKAAYNKAGGKSKFIETFFKTFSPNRDTLLGKTITEANAPMFFADLASGDSVSIERAINLVDRIDFAKEHVDSMIWYIDNFEFPDNDKEETAIHLIEQLGYIKHPQILTYLTNKYEHATDDYLTQFACLKALTKYGTKKSYTNTKKLLLQEPPITRTRGPVNNFFYYLDDSLSLTAKLYPDLWDLLLYTDYREPVYKLSARLLDSNLIKSKSYKREKPLILREAKGETAYKSIGTKETSKADVDLDDIDYYYSFGKKISHPISTIDQFDITYYLKLLMPYYEKDKKVKAFVNGLLTHKKEKFRFATTVMLAKHNVAIPDSNFTNLSKSPDYRFAFYKALHHIGKTALFDTAYLSPQSLMESAIFASSSIDIEDSVQFVSKKLIKNKFEEGYVYFFKSQSSYSNKWYIHIAGLQPKDSNEVTAKYYPKYVDVKASSVYIEAEIEEKIQEWVEYFNLLGRERVASSGYYDEEYD